jgi:large subunit ribosomal protein L20
MARVKSGKVTHARHKKVLDAAKGYYGAVRATSAPPRRPSTRRTSTPPATARTASATSARCGSSGSTPPCRAVDAEMTYSRFINALTKAGIEVDRKVLADLAVQRTRAFGAIVEKAKAALA